MSDALALPPHPNTEHFHNLVKDFQSACKTGDPVAVRGWAVRCAEALAHLQNLPDTPELRRSIRLDAERIERDWQILEKSNEHVRGCSLAGAQLLVARCHGFAGWPEFVTHIDEIAGATSPVSQFEAAVDAVVTGDINMIQSLLKMNPELVRARSAREHGSTLLHYVAANGVEDFRQKTPGNIIDVATLLLDSGADVNAQSEAYGGRWTTLGLAATSYHPDAAGVQLALLELLLERGATIDGPGSASGVNACLHNGRGEAAEYLAYRGARLDLEGAAGVGRLDLVKGFFDEAGDLQTPATRRELIDGFTWACEFGRNSVVEFLLDHGISVGQRLKGGETGLHWAAYEGHADTVRLLLDRGAPVDLADETHGGTPLGWALYAWGNRRPRERERRSYYEAVAILVRAGSELDSRWLNLDADRERAGEKMRSDSRMMAALRGEMLEENPTSMAKPRDSATRAVQLQMETPQDLTCAFSPDRTRAATGVVGRSVRVWSVETGECLAQLVGHTERVWGLAWSLDGERLLSGAWDNTARLWDIKTGKCIQTLEGHSGFVRALEFSADGRRAITAGGDGSDRSVRVWNLETGECLRVFEGHTDGAYCARLTADGLRAISGSRDGTIRVWDVATGDCLRVIDAHAAHVQYLALNEGEQHVLSCSMHVRLWDLESGRCLQTFEGHTDTIRTVEWSPDQRYVLSASHDRTVRVWETQSGLCLKVLEGHPTLVVSAAWSADGRRVISCDEDAQIRIWNWDEKW